MDIDRICDPTAISAGHGDNHGQAGQVELVQNQMLTSGQARF